MSKPIASYLVRVHLRAVEDEEAPVEPPGIAAIEAAVRAALAEAVRADVTVYAERVDK